MKRALVQSVWWRGLVVGASSVVAAGLNSSCSSSGERGDREALEPASASRVAQPLSTYAVLSDSQKEAAALGILDAFVARAETFWCDNGTVSERCSASYQSPESSGYFFAEDADGVTQPRGEGEVALIYATLLTERPAQATFGGIPRATVLAHAQEAIRHVLSTNVGRCTGPGGVTDCYAGGDPLQWGGPRSVEDATYGRQVWQASMFAYNAAWAAQLLWNQLLPSTQSMVTQVVFAEANVTTDSKDPKTITNPGDTRAEDNAWNTGILAAAAAMYPINSPRRSDWMQAAKEFAVNAFTKASDSTNPELIDSVAMSTWKTTTNINEDLTLFNHSFFHPTYLQGLYQNLSDSASFYQAVGVTPPQAFSYRLPSVWSTVLGPLMTDDGDLLHPVGTDWTRHDWQHLTTLSVLATRLQNKTASVFESRGLQLLTNRQAGQGNGSLFGSPRLGYEADVARNVAGVYWNHKLFAASPSPTEAEFNADRATLQGVRQLPDAKLIVNSQAGAVTTLSWDDGSNAEPSLQIVPSSAANLDDPVLMAALPKSGFHVTPGNVGTYSCDCRANFFSSAATSAASGTDFRNMSVTSFPDGTVLMLDCLAGGSATHAFNWGFEAITGVTGPRTIYAQDGIGLGDHAGNWLNVADRFGLIVEGGGGLTAYQTLAHPTNGPRNNNIEIEGSKGLGTGYRVAIVLPNANHLQTSALSTEVRRLTAAPAGWAGMTARALDGTERLAVGRWSGAASASFTLTTPRGAPIFDQATVVNGMNGTVSYSLASPASTGATARYYLATTLGRPVTATAMTDGRIQLVNSGASATTVTVNWVDLGGGLRTTSRSVGAGQTMYALGSDTAVRVVYPSASTTTTEPGPAYPPWKVFDADTSSTDNFWVSAPVALATSPQQITLDYGANTNMGRVTMIPRVNYGPKSYTVQTSTDGTTWTTRATVANGANATIVSPFTPVSARYVRLNVTDTYGSVSPVQQPQVRELQVASL